MYRLLNLDKDTYITDKIIRGSGSVTSNVGEAGTLDLFKVWSQLTSGSTPTIENSRVLIHPDLSEIRALTGSVIDFSDSSFKVYLRMKAVYGGMPVPSNYTLSLLPLAKFWDEGRGFDVQSFRDLDAANWITASVSTGTPVSWSVTGANAFGNLADPSVDVWVSGNLGAGSQSLEVTQTFLRGDGDLLMDVTTLVSGVLAGSIPDYGWRLSFSGTLETNDNSYFVKRFGSRHTSNPALHPRLVVVFNDNLQDDGNDAVLGLVTNTIRTYNTVQGAYSNWFSGSTPVTGAGCATLFLVASKSVTFQTTSFQQNFSASITYYTSSVQYFSTSFPVSQSTFGGHQVTGFYFSPVLLNPQTNTSLATFLSSSKTITFQSYWKSNDTTVLYSSGSWLTFTLPQSGEEVIAERNFVVNVLNLKTDYRQDQVVRFKVFVQDRNTELPAFRLPVPVRSLILKTMYWRLINAFSREEIIPFDTTGTQLSSDGFTMWFDLWAKDLDPNVVYELEFKITENSRDYLIVGEGFRFKVLP